MPDSVFLSRSSLIHIHLFQVRSLLHVQYSFSTLHPDVSYGNDPGYILHGFPLLSRCSVQAHSLWSVLPDCTDPHRPDLTLPDQRMLTFRYLEWSGYHSQNDSHSSVIHHRSGKRGSMVCSGRLQGCTLPFYNSASQSNLQSLLRSHPSDRLQGIFHSQHIYHGRSVLCDP